MRWITLFLAILVFTAGPARAEADFRNVGFIFSSIKEDRVFNTLALSALRRFEERPDLRIRQRVVANAEESRRAIRDFAQRGVGIIVLLGYMHGEAVAAEAPDFPHVRFTLIDGMVGGDNVRSVLFREEEAAYLVGLAAGLTTRSNTLGFVGGMPIPPVRRYACGFVQGVRDAAPDAMVTVRYLATSGDGFRERDRARRIATEMVTAGADILFPAAGVAGLDVLAVATENDRLAIGVDSNLNDYRPGYILTSAIKRVDVAVAQALEAALSADWTAGTVSLGLAEQGVDWAVDDDNRALVTGLAPRIEEARAAIIAGNLTVNGLDPATCP